MPELVYRDIKASGARLRVMEAGEGPPVVLLHSLLFQRETWAGVFDDLAQHFRVIAPDLPGFGESEKPNPARFAYSFSAFSHALADLYAGLRLGPSHLIGHGLGGAIAITLAARHPELVSRLVVVDPLCYRPPPDPLRRLALLPVIGGFGLKQLWGRGAFRSYFHQRIFSEHHAVPEERIDRYYDAFNPPAARACVLATLRATADTRPIIADTARVSAPSLVIWGRADKLYPCSFGQRLAREMRNTGLELMASGHAPHEEQPKAFVEVVSRFCRAERAGR
ncbi:MAG TPA: alpha/beta hydrolase [Polyangiaceae bacterium]|nr:alpha/beta hydrolase [Polyangiaceae bacterium]